MRLDVCLIIAVVLMHVGCATTKVRPRAPQAAVLAANPPTTHNVYQNANLVVRCADRMQSVVRQLADVRRTEASQSARALAPRSQEAVEWLYSDFLSCRRTLQEVARRDPTLTDLATNEQIRGDASLISSFLDDDLMTRTLNQSFHRSGISNDTFDLIAFEVTSPEVIDRLDNTRSSVSLVSTEAAHATRARQSADEAKQLIQRIIKRRSPLFSRTTNQLWHAAPTRAIAASKQVLSKQFLRTRSTVIERVGRLKNPIARPLSFSNDQKAWIHSSLEPGDVLLTYTYGFASNYFLPGNFKHAITYVGTPWQRERIGLTPERAALFPEPRRSRLAAALRQTTLDSGEPADVIESLAEGVIFANLEQILDTRINRLVVLRPRLNREERLAQLADVFSFVGDEYDFFFDFADGSDQVCTEVVYRSLQGRGGIDFTLARRAGQQTLSADDIIDHYLQSPGQHFDCILIVDEDERVEGQAKVRSRASAQMHLAKLMGSSR